MKFKSVVTLLIFALLMPIIGCKQKAPDAERKLAEKAFRDAAVGKDCDKENYLAAEELLNRARELVNKKKYKEAKEIFISVTKKSKAVTEYFRTHPDECAPKKPEPEVKEEEEVVEETVQDPAEDPEMELPVIHFEFNEYTILSEDMEKLELTARWMQNFEEASIRVEGHADERGSIDYNMSLGEKRAREVRKQLILQGVDKARIKIISYGEERPVDEGHNEDAWKENRRAEMKRVN
jgi:peptidoglycan-associated lipoprotein